MSLAAMPVEVALVDESGSIDASTLSEVAGALNAQVLRDFAPAWHVKATVGAYDKAPAGTWAIKIRRKLDDPNALGYHTDDRHQPYALVEYTPDWTVTVSHELLEMLADPWGNRLHSAKHLPGRSHDGRVRYLLEVCDPCEATSYEVGGVPMSDFLLPAYYRSRQHGLVSHAGGVHSPLQVADGGYISFMDGSHRWWQRFAKQGGKWRDMDLGVDQTAFRSLREMSDHFARLNRAP